MIILVSFNFSVASTASTRKFYDTSINPKTAATLTKNDFLNLYAWDDSSKALTQFYFAKRNRGKKMIATSTAISGGIAAIAIIAAIAHSNSSSGTTTNVPKTDEPPPFPLLLLFILCPVIPFLIMGIRLRTKYSSQKLLLQLNNYSTGKPIPKWIAKSHSFKNILRRGYQN